MDPKDELKAIYERLLQRQAEEKAKKLIEQIDAAIDAEVSGALAAQQLVRDPSYTDSDVRFLKILRITPH